MSIAMMNAALNADPGKALSASQKFVLLLLSNNANEEGIAFPSVRRLCDYSNLDERTIQRAIAVLEEKGYVTTVRRSGRSTYYHLHLLNTPGTGPGVQSSASQKAAGAQNAPKQTVAIADAGDRIPQPREVASGSVSSTDQGNSESPTPGTVTGVTLSTTCGSLIHTPGRVPPRGDMVPGVPPAGCHPPPAGCHPYLSPNDQIEPSPNLRAPDVLKNGSRSSERTQIPIRTAVRRLRRAATEPPQTPEQTEQSRQAQLQRIDAALARKAASG